MDQLIKLNTIAKLKYESIKTYKIFFKTDFVTTESLFFVISHFFISSLTEFKS